MNNETMRSMSEEIADGLRNISAGKRARAMKLRLMFEEQVRESNERWEELLKNR